MKKVMLRAMEPEDLEWLYRIENDRELWEVGTTNVPYSRYALHDFIAHSSGDIYTDGQVRLMVETEDGEVVGMADVVNFDAKNCRAELGLVIDSPHRRKGYATQVLGQMEDYALRILHLHQLYVCIAADNEPSLALFNHHGYRQSAVLPEWLYDGKAFHSAVLMQKIL